MLTGDTWWFPFASVGAIYVDTHEARMPQLKKVVFAVGNTLIVRRLTLLSSSQRESSGGRQLL